MVGAAGGERHPVAKKMWNVGAEGEADKSSLPALGVKTSPILPLLYYRQMHLSGKTCQNVAEEQHWMKFLLDRSLLIAIRECRTSMSNVWPAGRKPRLFGPH